MSHVKEFSAVLCMGRCKSPGSLKAFLCCVPGLSGASFLILSFLRPHCGAWLQSDGATWQVFLPAWAPSGLTSSRDCSPWWLWHPLFTDTAGSIPLNIKKHHSFFHPSKKLLYNDQAVIRVGSFVLSTERHPRNCSGRLTCVGSSFHFQYSWRQELASSNSSWVNRTDITQLSQGPQVVWLQGIHLSVLLASRIRQCDSYWGCPVLWRENWSHFYESLSYTWHTIAKSFWE